MTETVSRAELNGLGARVSETEKGVAALNEFAATSKQDRRDLWLAVTALRTEDARIERLVHQVSVKVAGISAISAVVTAVLTAAATAVVMKFLSH